MAMRQVSILLSSQIVKLLLSLLIQILIARLLLPEGRGIYGICLATSAILLVLTHLGNEYGIRYLLVQGGISSGQAFWYLLMTAGLSFAISLCIILTLTLFDFWLTDIVTRTQLNLASLMAITQLMSSQTNVFMTIKEKYTSASLISIGEEVTKLILMVGLLTYHPTVEAALFSLICGNVISLVFIVTYNRFTSLSGKGLHTQDLVFIYKYGGRSVWLNLSNLSTAHLGTLVLSGLMSVEKIGVYNLAFGIISRLQVVPDTLNRILVPKSVSSTDRAENHRLIKISVTGLAIVSFSLIPIVGFMAEPVFEVLFGEAYKEAGVISLLLFIGFTFKVVGKPIEAYFNEIIGQPSIIALLQITSVILMASLTYLGAEIFGLVGASIGSSFAFILSSALLFIVYASVTRQRIFRIFELGAFRKAISRKRH